MKFSIRGLISGYLLRKLLEVICEVLTRAGISGALHVYRRAVAHQLDLGHMVDTRLAGMSLAIGGMSLAIIHHREWCCEM